MYLVSFEEAYFSIASMHVPTTVSSARTSTMHEIICSAGQIGYTIAYSIWSHFSYTLATKEGVNDQRNQFLQVSALIRGCVPTAGQLLSAIESSFRFFSQIKVSFKPMYKCLIINLLRWKELLRTSRCSVILLHYILDQIVSKYIALYKIINKQNWRTYPREMIKKQYSLYCTLVFRK